MQKLLTRAEFHFVLSDGRVYKVEWHSLGIEHQSKKRFSIAVYQYGGYVEGFHQWTRIHIEMFGNNAPSYPNALTFLNSSLNKI